MNDIPIWAWPLLFLAVLLGIIGILMWWYKAPKE